MKSCSDFLDAFKESGHESAIADATDLAEKLNVDPVFPAPRRGCVRKDAQRGENTGESAEALFKKKFFIPLVDVVRVSINERFEQFQKHSEL